MKCKCKVWSVELDILEQIVLELVKLMEPFFAQKVESTSGTHTVGFRSIVGDIPNPHYIPVIVGLMP